jgi:hypothetical protein
LAVTAKLKKCCAFCYCTERASFPHKRVDQGEEVMFCRLYSHNFITLRWLKSLFLSQNASWRSFKASLH